MRSSVKEKRRFIFKLFFMKRRNTFYLIALASIPMFAWEAARGIFNRDVYLFLYFTVITNACTWFYFILKMCYIRFSRKSFNVRFFSSVYFRRTSFAKARPGWTMSLQSLVWSIPYRFLLYV